MITLRLLILGLILVSFGGVQAQADTVNRKKHIVKVNHIFNIRNVNYQRSGESNFNGFEAIAEQKVDEFLVSSFLTISYLKVSKNHNLFELELRGVELERTKPTKQAGTLSSGRGSLNSAINLRSSMNFNLLKSDNTFLTLGLFSRVINRNERDYDIDFKSNTTIIDAGPVVKYGRINNKNLYIEGQLSFKAFRYVLEFTNNDLLVPFGAYGDDNGNGSRSSFYNYFSKDSERFYKIFELSASVGYNF